MSDTVQPEELVSGGTYRIRFDDCCVAGEFVATFRQHVYVDDSPELEKFLDVLLFDRVRLTHWAACTFEVPYAVVEAQP